ncbi:MAG: HAD-IA family hydrolase [Sciscionella sp.]|nr:HAD-IA family hydrolase [Sciscionella sp.]
MTIRGAMIDFSGTLFRLQYDEHLTSGLDAEVAAKIFRLLTGAVRPSQHLPASYHDDWQRRDLDPEIHRRVNIAALRHAGVTESGAAKALYERMLLPSSWAPYPDTIAALKLLRDKAIPVAVVSNIAWDITEVFARFGAKEYVDEIVLSYVEGAMKPDAAIFRAACDRLGVAPADVVMIGDSPAADGGAEAIGCAVRIVEPLAVDQRPHGLLDALASVGITDD